MFFTVCDWTPSYSSCLLLIAMHMSFTQQMLLIPPNRRGTGLRINLHPWFLTVLVSPGMAFIIHLVRYAYVCTCLFFNLSMFYNRITWKIIVQCEKQKLDNLNVHMWSYTNHSPACFSHNGITIWICVHHFLRLSCIVLNYMYS